MISRQTLSIPVSELDRLNALRIAAVVIAFDLMIASIDRIGHFQDQRRYG
jgi:hypothetical protein